MQFLFSGRADANNQLILEYAENFQPAVTRQSCQVQKRLYIFFSQFREQALTN